MYSEAERFRAIELYFTFCRKITSVICELDYPTERNLRRWVQAWEASGGDISSLPRKERYFDAQKQAAVGTLSYQLLHFFILLQRNTGEDGCHIISLHKFPGAG